MARRKTEKAPDFDGKSSARKLPTRPGVYLFRDEAGTALYVGKARNLRKRVSSYFDARPKGERIMRMVARIRQIEISVTRTEGEALLLENEWIKSLKPRYNVLLRDDKSYPWIMLTMDHAFPRIAFHRGARAPEKRYFGPYPSASSVRESINLIQKLFRLRNCEDSYFAHRRRPCLQYQIDRCTAPCVDYVDREQYRAQVRQLLAFLEGRDRGIHDPRVGVAVFLQIEIGGGCLRVLEHVAGGLEDGQGPGPGGGIGILSGVDGIGLEPHHSSQNPCVRSHSSLKALDR